MENSSSSFKIKSLAKTTACEQELGDLLDWLHKKRKKRGRMLSCLMCVISGQLGPGWVCVCLRSAPRREEEGSRVFSAEQREEEGGSRLCRTEFPLLPVCYLLCLVSQ